jgi:hypothetical protein
MKRVDRSSKGHCESEAASRTATLGLLHNPFEPYFQQTTGSAPVDRYEVLRPSELLRLARLAARRAT